MLKKRIELLPAVKKQEVAKVEEPTITFKNMNFTMNQEDMNEMLFNSNSPIFFIPNIGVTKNPEPFQAVLEIEDVNDLFIANKNRYNNNCNISYQNIFSSRIYSSLEMGLCSIFMSGLHSIMAPYILSDDSFINNRLFFGSFSFCGIRGINENDKKVLNQQTLPEWLQEKIIRTGSSAANAYYDYIINMIYKKPNAVDINGLVEFACEKMNIDCKELPEESYRGIVSTYLLSVAKEDILKFNELVEMNCVETACEFKKHFKEVDYKELRRENEKFYDRDCCRDYDE